MNLLDILPKRRVQLESSDDAFPKTACPVTRRLDVFVKKRRHYSIEPPGGENEREEVVRATHMELAPAARSVKIRYIFDDS